MHRYVHMRPALLPLLVANSRIDPMPFCDVQRCVQSGQTLCSWIRPGLGTSCASSMIFVGFPARPMQMWPGLRWKTGDYSLSNILPARQIILALEALLSHMPHIVPQVEASVQLLWLLASP